MPVVSRGHRIRRGVANVLPRRRHRRRRWHRHAEDLSAHLNAHQAQLPPYAACRGMLAEGPLQSAIVVDKVLLHDQPSVPHVSRPFPLPRPAGAAVSAAAAGPRPASCLGVWGSSRLPGVSKGAAAALERPRLLVPCDTALLPPSGAQTCLYRTDSHVNVVRKELWGGEELNRDALIMISCPRGKTASGVEP